MSCASRSPAFSGLHVSTLKELFPKATSYCIKSALADHGASVDDAAAALAAGHYDHAFDNALLQLKLLFPLHSDSRLEKALKDHILPSAAVEALSATVSIAPAIVISSSSTEGERPSEALPESSTAVAPRSNSDKPSDADGAAAVDGAAGKPRLMRGLTQGDMDFATDAVQSLFPKASPAEVGRLVRDISNSEPAGPLEMLQHMFPTAKREVLQRCLERTEGSLDEAAAAYMQYEDDEKAALLAAAGDTEDEAGPDHPVPRPTGLGRTFGGADYYDEYDEDEEEEEEEEPEHYPSWRRAPKRTRAVLRAAPAAKRRAAIARAAPPSPPPPDDTERSFEIAARPAQSLLCVGDAGDAKRYILHNVPKDDLRAHMCRCFRMMLEREQEHWDNYVVFYHSYSFAALLYEVQAAIARALYDLAPDFAPLPRLLKRPFDSRPSMDMLMDEFKRMHGQDHNPEFRAVAISVSNSLFGFGSEAPPITCFRGGYSCTDLSFREALLNILRSCGLPADQLSKVANDVVQVANDFGMGGNYAPLPSESKTPPAPGHRGRGRGRHYVAPTHGYASFTPRANQGHMLQIFVHKDTVDEVAYQSHPMGVPVKTSEPLSSFLRNTRPASDTSRGFVSGFHPGYGGAPHIRTTQACNGQARIFMHPTVFTDPAKARIYHYCANADLMTDGPTSRASFLQALDVALAPIVGSVDGLRRAHLGVEGRDS